MAPADWGVQSQDTEVCYPLQKLELELPGGRDLQGEVMGVQFVVRSANGRWFKARGWVRRTGAPGPARLGVPPACVSARCRELRPSTALAA